MPDTKNDAPKIADEKANHAKPVIASVTGSKPDTAANVELATADLAAEQDAASALEEMAQQGSAEARYRLVSDVHGFIDEQVRFAEAKAALIAGACGFLFSIPFGQSVNLHLVFGGPPSFAHWLLLLLAVLIGAALIYTVVQCMKCIFPWLSFGGNSKIYFGDIIGPSGATSPQRRSWYVEAIDRLSEEATVQAMAEHVYDLSAVALRKHRLVQRATIGLLVVSALYILIGLDAVYLIATRPSP